MSIEAYVWALKHAPVPPADRDRVVLFALADHADERGRNAFPSQATIATYIYGEASPAGLRKVQRALKSLIEGGWITPDPDNAKLQAVMPRVHPSQRPVAYTLNLSFVRTPPVTSVGTHPSPVSGGRAGAPDTSDPGPPSPVSRPPVTSDGRTVSNHQENRQGGGGRSVSTGADLFMRSHKKNGAGAPGMDEKRSTGPARCTAHAHLPDDDPGPPCHACKHVRLTRETTDQDQRTAATTARRDCLWCDETGWRLDPDTGVTILPVIRCDHTPWHDHHVIGVQATIPNHPDPARRVAVATEHQPGAPAPADQEDVSPEGPDESSSRAPAA